MATVKEIIEKITPRFKSISESPRLDAELIVGLVAHKTREELFAHPQIELSSRELRQLSKLVKRREKGVPIAYLSGHKEFWDLDLEVGSDVLIPRPETEMLVEWTLMYCPKEDKCRIADLGTGSGAIALALARERPQWRIHAADNSRRALKVAKRNAKRHGIKNVKFYSGEWCEALPRNDYHAILGNPPYVPEVDSHWPQLRFEPREALAAGADGLDAIRVIIPQAYDFLRKDGWLVLEHGDHQSEKMRALMEEAGYQAIEDLPDLAGLPRMMVGRKH